MLNEAAVQKEQPINLLGVKINPLSMARLNETVVQLVRQKQHALVIHVNIYGLNLAQKMPWLKQFYNQANLTVCDGAGPILGGFLGGRGILWGLHLVG